MHEALALALGILLVRVPETVELYAFDGTYLGDDAFEELRREQARILAWRDKAARKLGIDPPTTKAGTSAAHLIGYELQEDMAEWAMKLLSEHGVRLCATFPQCDAWL